MTPPVPRSRPDVVAFDVNETLLDLAPVRATLVELGEPAPLLGTVFARTLLTGFAAAAVGSWCRFHDAFDAALAQETGLSAGQRASVADAFGELSPHPDVEPALRRLTEAGIRVVTLSHGSPGVAEAGLERGGITPLVERTMTSETIRAWKPAREVYLWAAGLCDVPPDRMALVAAHGWDVLGARRAGLTGAWFPRGERVFPAVYGEPDVTGADLAGAVDGLLALPPR
ncbi:haloacid dehalogenase [Blastococcus sp. MG754426]|uniref:HAD-IA family hydrolase n=1 Tax=unclassified Blastococcus TaxID=2619396 RepID=UPI001EEF7CEC|nr:MULTISPECIES: HAD-IA family hydrolase [unclassified Blastococcus]MCF6509473.1 haloacid dehalogenase [Blastococcus sp. MG754426]MCF6513988.1 haloacid dehalogenase [Blastococcus sp. MG754427]